MNIPSMEFVPTAVERENGVWSLIFMKTPLSVNQKTKDAKFSKINR